MSREADYTIQGFIYQFHKTIEAILRADDDSIITVEGIIEDIDVAALAGITAIQCKYHESADGFTLSSIYKPVLQMMDSFHRQPAANVTYHLYAHFNGEVAGQRALTKAELEEILLTKNRELQSLVTRLNGVDLDAFLGHFVLEFGNSFDDLVKEVQHGLELAGIPNADIELFAHPTAINHIAHLSIKHNSADRQLSRRQLLSLLKAAKTTMISRWTLALKTAKKLLDARRKQLALNLEKNVRSRSFLLSQAYLQKFDSSIVIFIEEFLDKYHHKIVHTETPAFFFDCPPQTFDAVRQRLHQKGIQIWDGFVGGTFYLGQFQKKPVVRKVSSSIERSYDTRIAHYTAGCKAIVEPKAQDLFIISDIPYTDIDCTDVNVELLQPETILELKYLLGMTNAYE